MKLNVSIALLASALAVSSASAIYARQTEEAPVAPRPEQASEDLAWVDPVITGPVSPQYKRLRQRAGCDSATWPHIPAVCYPN